MKHEKEVHQMRESISLKEGGVFETKGIPRKNWSGLHTRESREAADFPEKVNKIKGNTVQDTK